MGMFVGKFQCDSIFFPPLVLIGLIQSFVVGKKGGNRENIEVGGVSERSRFGFRSLARRPGLIDGIGISIKC